jgi:hypothetical protein
MEDIMELKKTTLLSFLVSFAGILAEIIFRDVLSKSVFGVVLSVLLAAVIMVLAYFVYDGVYSFFAADREINRKHQEEYEQKMYSILNEQLQFEKAIYKEVRALLQASEKSNLKKKLAVPQAAEASAAEVPKEQLEALASSIKENTTMTAKLIAKYVNRNTDELKQVIEQNQTEMQKLVKELEK